MKMAKKVLSVILAVVMALSCFAVASSAFVGNDPALATTTKKAAIRLTAGVDAGSANSTYSKTAVPTIANLTSINNTTVKAAAGDTIYVYVYGSANFYVSTFGFELFYPAGWQTPTTRAKTFAPSRTVTAANLQKIFYGNNQKPYNNPFIDLYTIGTGCGITEFSTLEGSNNTVGAAAVEKSWPTNPDGTIVDGYHVEDDNTTPDTSKWNFMRFLQVCNTDTVVALQLDNAWANKNWTNDACEGIFDMEYTTIEDAPDFEGTWIYRVPIYIPEGTADGTYQILIPEQAANSPEKSKGFTQVVEMLDWDQQHIDDGYFDYEYDAQVRMGNKWRTNDEANTAWSLDLSGAVITVKVGLDYDNLAAAIKEADTKVQSDYTTDSWSDFSEALSAAKTLNTARNAANQTAIDNATSALTTAMDNLVEASAEPELDYTDLEEAIAATDVVGNEDEYTAATWATYTEALAAANALNTNRDAANQEEIAGVVTALVNATAGLAEAADTSALEEAVAAANAANEADYDDVVWSELQDYVANAENNYLGKDLAAADAQTDINDLADAINGILANTLDKAALEAAIAAANAFKETAYAENYTPASWSAFNDALAAAEAAMSSTSQKDIFDAAAALTAAQAGLVEADADYTALNALIAEADALKAADYKAGWDAFASALTAAKAVPTGLKAKDQATIDNAKDALATAKDALTPWGDADLTALETALNTRPEYDTSNYTTDTMIALYDAQDVGYALLQNAEELTEADQEAINEATANINAALAGLKLKDADVTALNAAIAKAAEVDANLVESKTALNEAVAAANTLLEGELTILDQTAINNATAAINKAYDELVWLGADYTALNNAKAAFEALVENYYDAGDYAAVKALYEAACSVEANLGKADQNIVDTAATNLQNAIGALEMLDADYSALEAAITAANKIKETSRKSATENVANYTAETWADFAAAKTAAEAIESGLKKDSQGAIDTAATTLDEARENLEWAPFDYTETNALLAEIAALNAADYTATSWENLQTKKEALVMDYTMENFTKAMGQYTQLNTAKKNLVELADANYDALDAVIADADKKVEDDYTAETWAPFAAALADAKAVARNLKEDKQGVIDDAKTTLENAMAALEEKPVLKDADYTALDAVIADADKKVEDDYTAETWAPFAEALADAKAVARDLKEDNQSVIDNAKTTLENAMAALEEKSTEPEEPAKGDVQKVEYDEAVAAGQANTYKVTVKDRAMMVQFIEADHGNGTGTRTFDRYDDRVKITSYKADGTVCDSLDMDLAYEVWEITTPLADGNIDVRVKANGCSAYETVDLALRFVNEFKTLNNEVVSITLAKTTGKKGSVKATVVTGADVKTVQLKNDRGETFTFGTAKATDNGDGTLTWACSVYFHGASGHTDVATIRVLDDNGWHNSDVTASYTIQ